MAGHGTVAECMEKAMNDYMLMLAGWQAFGDETGKGRSPAAER
jgi:hypothetical protein